MGSELFSLLNDVALDGLSIHVSPEEYGKTDTINVGIVHLLMKLSTTKGITIENLSLSIPSIDFKGDMATLLTSTTIVVESLVIKIAQPWVNEVLKKYRAAYEETDLHDLEVVFLPKKLLVRGSYKKGVAFPFSIEIKTGIKNNKLAIELAHFNLMEILPLPQWVQNSLIDIFKDKLKQRFVDIQDHIFLIDVIAASPIPLELTIKDFRVEKETLVLEVGKLPKEACESPQAGPAATA
jgi:hypothetical protein